MKNIALGCALLCALSTASAVTFSPVKIDVDVGKQATFVQVENQDELAHTYEIQIFSWLGTTDEGAVLAPVETENIFTSRPVLNIPSKGKGTIRLWVRTRSEKPVDLYRVIVRDISVQTGAGARPQISMSMPLQVKNIKPAYGKLVEWEGGFKNTGNAALLINGISENGAYHPTKRYLLPGEFLPSQRKLTDISWLPGIQ